MPTDEGPAGPPPFTRPDTPEPPPLTPPADGDAPLVIPDLFAGSIFLPATTPPTPPPAVSPLKDVDVDFVSETPEDVGGRRPWPPPLAVPKLEAEELPVLLQYGPLPMLDLPPSLAVPSESDSVWGEGVSLLSLSSADLIGHRSQGIGDGGSSDHESDRIFAGLISEVMEEAPPEEANTTRPLHVSFSPVSSVDSFRSASGASSNPPTPHPQVGHLSLMDLLSLPLRVRSRDHGNISSDVTRSSQPPLRSDLLVTPPRRSSSSPPSQLVVPPTGDPPPGDGDFTTAGTSDEPRPLPLVVPRPSPSGEVEGTGGASASPSGPTGTGDHENNGGAFIDHGADAGAGLSGPDGSSSVDSSVPTGAGDMEDSGGASLDHGVGNGSGPSGPDGSSSVDSSVPAGAGDVEDRGRASADPGDDVGPDPSGDSGGSSVDAGARPGVGSSVAGGAAASSLVPGAASLANLISRLIQNSGPLSLRTNFAEELLSIASTAIERES